MNFFILKPLPIFVIYFDYFVKNMVEIKQRVIDKILFFI